MGTINYRKLHIPFLMVTNSITWNDYELTQGVCRSFSDFCLSAIERTLMDVDNRGLYCSVHRMLMVTTMTLDIRVIDLS